MADQVFEIDALRKRALELLRRHDSYMTVGAVAMALGVPLYAADCALESAYLAREATFEAGAGWKALPVDKPALGDEHMFQRQLPGGA
jgi:hypothetical protein